MAGEVLVGGFEKEVCECGLLGGGERGKRGVELELRVLFFALVKVEVGC